MVPVATKPGYARTSSTALAAFAAARPLQCLSGHFSEGAGGQGRSVNQGRLAAIGRLQVVQPVAVKKPITGQRVRFCACASAPAFPAGVNMGGIQRECPVRSRPLRHKQRRALSTCLALGPVQTATKCQASRRSGGIGRRDRSAELAHHWQGCGLCQASALLHALDGDFSVVAVHG